MHDFAEGPVWNRAIINGDGPRPVFDFLAEFSARHPVKENGGILHRAQAVNAVQHPQDFMLNP